MITTRLPAPTVTASRGGHPAHPAVEAPRAALLTVDATEASVPRLRRFVRHLTRWWALTEEVEHALCLVVTELGTNVVRHSGSPDLTVTLSTRPGALRLRVADSGYWLPAPAADGERAPDTDACGGRGLPLVMAYADHCEIRKSATGTTVSVAFALADAHS